MIQKHYIIYVENMVLPVALFLYKEHAEIWKNQIYGKRAIVVESQDVSLSPEAMHQHCNNQ